MSGNVRREAVDALARVYAGPASTDLSPYLQAVEDVRRLAPFTPEEAGAGESLGIEMAHIEMGQSERMVAMAYYIWLKAPGTTTIPDGIAQLSPAELDEFNRVASGEITLGELRGEGDA